MTQVDEKGHEDNTAVVTAHLFWSKHGQRNSRTGVSADYNNIFRTLLYSYSCGSQVTAQPSSGHILHARSCVRRDYPSEVTEVVSYCTTSKYKWSHVSQVDSRGNTFLSPSSDDTAGIQDPTYHMSCRTYI